MSPSWTSRARPLLALGAVVGCAAIVLHLVGWSPFADDRSDVAAAHAAKPAAVAAATDDEPDSELDRRGMERQLDDLERQIAEGEGQQSPVSR